MGNSHNVEHPCGRIGHALFDVGADMYRVRRLHAAGPARVRPDVARGDTGGEDHCCKILSIHESDSHTFTLQKFVTAPLRLLRECPGRNQPAYISSLGGHAVT